MMDNKSRNGVGRFGTGVSSEAICVAMRMVNERVCRMKMENDSF